MAKRDDGQLIVCQMPDHAGGGRRGHSRLSNYDAGEVAEAITLLETGRVDQASTRLRLLLKANGHPVPAPLHFRGVKPWRA